MRNFLFLIGFILLYISATGQTWGGGIIYKEFKIPLYGLKLDTTAFTVSNIVDDRENKLQLGEIYWGIHRSRKVIQIIDDFPVVFTPYFERAIRLAEVIDTHKVIVVFKDLSVKEPNPDKYVDNVKRRIFSLSVNYYLNRTNDSLFLLHDELKIDSIFIEKRYDIEDFTYSFFYDSFRKLTNYLKSHDIDSLQQFNPPEITTEKKSQDQPESMPSEASNIQKDSSIKKYEGQVFLKKKKNGKHKFEGIILAEHVKNAIIKEYEDQDPGKYLLKYLVVEKAGKTEIKNLEELSYRKNYGFHYGYIAIPAALLLLNHILDRN
jgi:hypothetical protein